jgi:rRNA maturation RNase YbeY
MSTLSGVILFFSDDTSFILRDKNHVRAWLKVLSSKHKKQIDSLNYIFVSDKKLLEMNQQYLQHDTLTDIITFDSSSVETISGEIYISIDRIRDNANQFGAPVRDELHRVIAHGLLHLCGFDDKSKQAQQRMRTEEDKALRLRRF